MAGPAAEAQTLVASQTTGAPGSVNHIATISFVPGADTGGFNFELTYSALATTATAKIGGSIPNGTVACRVPSAGRVRCMVVAVAAGADLGAGDITIAFDLGTTTGTMDLDGTASFFNQVAAVEQGSFVQGKVRIEEAPPETPPTISIADVSISEGNAGTKLATFTVKLSRASATPVSYDIATGHGTASDNDFVDNALVGQVIAAGQSSKTFSVTINGDTAVEGDETFTVNLNNVVGAVVGNSQALGKIVNDDNTGLSIADASVTEGNAGQSTASFVITLQEPMSVPVSFDITTSNGSATAGSDYVARSQSRIFDAGRTRTLFEVQVNGDSSAEADETFTVTISNVVGANLVDGVATGTIINDDPVTVPIAAIQGTGSRSPYTGEQVDTEGVVTALVSDGLYLQSSPALRLGAGDASQGLHVATSDHRVRVGDRLRVRGQILELREAEAAETSSLTTLAAIDLEVQGHETALPAPVVLDATVAGPSQGVAALERFEGMRVSVPRLSVVGPAGGSIDPRNQTARGDGRFYGVVEGVARPFREPGRSVLDSAAAVESQPAASAPAFDANPERLRIHSGGQRGAPLLSADVGDVATGLVGVLGYARGAYELLPDPGAQVNIRSSALPRPVRVPQPDEATVGTLVLRDFVDDQPGDGQSAITGNAYAIGLSKVANVICAYARSPDILGVAGIEGEAVLADLAAAVNARDGEILFPGGCRGDAGYRAFVLPANLAGQGTIGFLVRSADTRPGVARVEVLSLQQAAQAVRWRGPDGGSDWLFERPPLVLEARINANGASLPLTVILNQWTALESRESATTQDKRRARRAAQARELARILQARRRANPTERLLVLGGFDALEFSDGQEEPLAVLTADGEDAGARTMARAGLSNLTMRLPRAERYTVSREGNAEARDHVLANPPMLAAHPDLDVQVARINADFAEAYLGDVELPMRVSDHDPVVVYLRMH